MNAYIRFKLAMTENIPTIKPYEEAAWARLKDTEVTSIEVSLNLLEALHIRWVNLLRSMRPDDFQRKLNHPESGVQNLDQDAGALQLAWQPSSGAYYGTTRANEVVRLAADQRESMRIFSFSCAAAGPVPHRNWDRRYSCH